MSNFATTQDQVIHHSANAAAIVIPVMSSWLNGPLILTYLTGALGIIWYCILIGEKIIAWKRRHDYK
jgi:hypothetical protein